MTAQMLELIERVEKASGPDSNLGREVLLACGWAKMPTGYFLGQLYHWRSPDGKTSFDDDDFHRYDPTRSVDAGLRLFPKEWAWSIWADTNDRGYHAGIGPRATYDEWVHSDLNGYDADGKTAPLALLAACLKAIKQMKEGK